MQTTSAPMAWLFLQENVLPQWQQKIALRAENKWVQTLPRPTNIYFLRKQFSVAIEATIFRIERRAIEAHRLQSIFTFLYSIIKRCKVSDFL